MLKLKKVSGIKPIKNESDFYIKIKIIFSCQYTNNTPICYWSTGSQGSLIEIGIQKLTGAIQEITVVSAPKIYHQNTQNINKKTTEIAGLPLFEMNPWNQKNEPGKDNLNHYIKGYSLREAKKFDLCIGEKSVSILFSSDEISLDLVNDSIIFGFNKDNLLCSIKILGMKLNEEGVLEKIIK